ncbi:jg8282 [Pararge aegeria aegeria]|uniref:Jg8282 protein n=2 Tax=Pararge aegeria TaxID=116150 RepID=A0A8S4RES6_9NEOP|nr:jg8282 [Pararge aegeria aegeria]
MVFPKRSTLRRKVKERFEELQLNLKERLQPLSSKMSFTIDGWTSIAGRSYYGVTIHYIDNEWKYRSVVLDFIPSRGRHTGEDIATIFHECLLEYGIIDKIQGITVDNATANTKFMYELGKQLPPHFDSDNQHFRCFAHILNLGVQDLLKTLALHLCVCTPHAASFDLRRHPFHRAGTWRGGAVKSKETPSNESLSHRSKRPKSKFEEFFEIIHASQTALCKLCQHKKIEIKMKNRNTSGLRKHLMSFHKKESEIFLPVKPKLSGDITSFLVTAGRSGQVIARLARLLLQDQDQDQDWERKTKTKTKTRCIGARPRPRLAKSRLVLAFGQH